MNTRVLLLVILAVSLAVISAYAYVPAACAPHSISFSPSPLLSSGEMSYSQTNGAIDSDAGALQGDSPSSRGTPFPRPAYNSGWLQAVYGNLVIKHNLGGNPDEYVVFVDSKDSTGAIHDVDGVYTTGDNWIGMMWYGLTDSSITVSLAGASPSALYRFVRVRIWLVK